MTSTATEQSEAWKVRMLNIAIRREQRRLGIFEHTEFNRESGIRVLAALRKTPTPINHIDRTEGDELIDAIATWHEPCLLSQYKDNRRRSPEAERDYKKPGVYVILEATRKGLVPRWVETWVDEASARYVGESNNLAFRLSQHATGRSSTPATVVTMDYLEFAEPSEKTAYDISHPSEQRAFREFCMDQRRLWVKTTHTSSKSEAQRLENAVINLYRAKGIELWNRVLYKGRKAWR